METKADYSFVKDPNGKIAGLWIKEIQYAANPAYLHSLLKKHHGPQAEKQEPVTDELLKLVLSQNFRIAANNFNKQGGCFVMFGGMPAPGEK
jgi:hypothetical protein